MRSDGKGDPEVASNCGSTLGNTHGVWRVPGACRASLPGCLGRSRTMASQKDHVDPPAVGSTGWAPAPPLSLQGSGLLGMAQGGLPRAQPLLSCLVLRSITEHTEGARPVLHRSQLGITFPVHLEVVRIPSLLYIRAAGGGTETLSGLPKSHSWAAIKVALASRSEWLPDRFWLPFPPQPPVRPCNGVCTGKEQRAGRHQQALFSASQGPGLGLGWRWREKSWSCSPDVG